MEEEKFSTPGEPELKKTHMTEFDSCEESLEAESNSMLPESKIEGEFSTCGEPKLKTPRTTETNTCEKRQEQCKVQVDYMSMMPLLVQDKIFECLGTRDKAAAALVCSSWKQAVYRPRYWQQVQAKLNLDRMSKPGMDSLKERQIRKVKVVQWSGKGNVASFFLDFDCLNSLHLCRMEGFMLFLTTAKARFVSLRELRLHTKNIAQERALTQSLVSFPNLEILEVEGVVSCRLLEACVDHLKGLKQLTLISVDMDPSEEAQELDLEAVALMDNLQDLSLDGFILENIHVLSNRSKPLKRLSVTICQLSKEEWADVLCRMTSLEELQLLTCFPRLDSDGLKLLAENLKQLKKLRFWYGEKPNFTDEDLVCLSQISSLRDIQLLGTQHVTAEGFLSLCKNQRHLTALELDGCTAMTTSVMEEMAKMQSLTELSLSECSDSKKLVKILRQSSLKLRKLHLHSCGGFKSGVEDVAQMSSLCDLSLSCMPLGPDGMSQLNQATFSLQTLSLVNCGATVIGLLPLLKKQRLLQKLVMKEKSEPGSWLVSFLQSILPYIEECQVVKCTEL